MILAIDIGNTTVALGGIRDGRVCFVAHMDTVRTRTAAEYRAEMEKVFSHRRHPEKPIRFEGAVLTSVVPQITGALAECARHYTGQSRSSSRPTSSHNIQITVTLLPGLIDNLSVYDGI